MQFDIVHTIGYAFSRDVFLEPHEVRLQPRNCGSQTLEKFHLEVNPEPAGISYCLDAEGNQVASLWFDGLHQELKVTVRSHVRTQRENPFDYLLRKNECQLPLQYDATTAPLLGPALRFAATSKPQDDLQAFAGKLSGRADHQLLRFLDLLNDTLYSEFECIHRETGDAWPASYTLAKRRGACRDLAMLFIAICRCREIAARFVSGYQQGDREQDERHLHAWAEVFIPGAGWRGYDPTHGLAVADGHVAAATSVSPQLAAPLVGSFRGTGVTATLRTRLDIEIVQDSRMIQQIQQQ